MVTGPLPNKNKVIITFPSFLFRNENEDPLSGHGTLFNKLIARISMHSIILSIDWKHKFHIPLVSITRTKIHIQSPLYYRSTSFPIIHYTMERHPDKASPLLFAVNQQRFELFSVDPSTTLLQFLRQHTSFKSVKLSCGEGLSLSLELLHVPPNHHLGFFLFTEMFIFSLLLVNCF